MLRTSEWELRARPAALPALLHLFSALLSIIAHEPKVPQGTAFWREPDGIICNVGVKLIMTVGTARVESSVTSVTLQASACDEDIKAQWQSRGAAQDVVQCDAPSTPPQCLQASAKATQALGTYGQATGIVDSRETPEAFSVPELSTRGEHRAGLCQSRLPFA